MREWMAGQRENESFRFLSQKKNIFSHSSALSSGQLLESNFIIQSLLGDEEPLRLS
jgi:hypothetical protein